MHGFESRCAHQRITALSDHDEGMTPKKSISLRGPSALLAMLVAVLIVFGGALGVLSLAVGYQNYWLILVAVIWVFISFVPSMFVGMFAGAAFNKYIRSGRDTKPESVE